ncbi:MAG TPA: tripartite tricarboxylate transporter substrate binding protein, partial [Lautropia sp.]|nr:tripartite tricarboxylate transporter substrate binding protein [Lautropia sp.]
QAWPARPIRFVVNFPPGGAADVIARAVAAPLGEKLGQPVVVENRAGANGNIGGEVVAKAAPDGYTFLMSSAGVSSINPQLYQKMPFDPAKDLVPVAAAARVLVFLETRPTLPVADFAEFVAYLKANPGKASYGTPGNGSSPHLAAEMLAAMTGTDAVHVPYRGAAPALTDLLANQIDFMFDPGPGLAQVRAGKLRLLAVGSLNRTPLFPETPTLDELGLKGFDADSLFGFYAPAGVDPVIVRQMNEQISAILASPAVVQRIADLGGEAAPMTPAAFADRIASDSVRFGKLIRERGIKAE